MERKLFYGGKIITMDNTDSIVEAVLVEDGLIKDLGDCKTLKDKYNDAVLVNLNNNVMMPGLIEPHAHFDLCAMVTQMHSLSGIEFETADAVLEQLRKAVESTEAGHWVMCFGLDFLINRDLPNFDRYFLDSFSTVHPIAIIIQSMHTIYLNSLALKLANITRDTKDTRDGHCIKDENGEPLGILTEQGFIVPIVNLWVNDYHLEPIEFIRREIPKWLKAGVTTTWLAGVTPLFPDHFKLLYNAFNDENFPLRVDYSITFNSIENGTVNLELMDHFDTVKTHFTGIKAWYDGSPYTGNTFMYENYLENDTMQNRLYVPANQHGERLFTQDFFYQILKKYHDLGYQLSIHAQGDRAATEVIDILERILSESPRKDHRHRLEHCAFISKENVRRASNLGITISFHNNHIYYYAEALSELVVGEERTQKMLPCKTAIDSGMHISLHSDDPMYSTNPLLVARNAMTRASRNGKIVGIDEAINRRQALRAVTIDAAWQLGREKELGSIEIGKIADFTILKDDPYTVDIDKLGCIEVITTFLAGKDTRTFKF